MEGMTYEKDQQFCTIADAEKLNLKVEIDELDIDDVEVGQEAERQVRILDGKIVFDTGQEVKR